MADGLTRHVKQIGENLPPQVTEEDEVLPLDEDEGMGFEGLMPPL